MSDSEKIEGPYTVANGYLFGPGMDRSVVGPRDVCRELNAAHAVGYHSRDADIQRLSARVKELEDALVWARTTIEAWHGPVGWTEYQQSPEMKGIDAALSASPPAAAGEET